MRATRLLALLSLVVSAAGCGDKSPGNTTPPVTGTGVAALASVEPARGLVDGGTVAIVHGLNFREGATVTVGGSAAAAVRFVDSRTLTILTPKGSEGAADVTVKNPDAAATTLAGAFTFYARDAKTAAAPALTAVSPNGGPKAGGTYALVVGLGFQPDALLFVGRVPATEVTVGPDGKILSARTPAGATGSALDVEVTNPDGQSGKLASAFTYYDVEPALPAIAALAPMAGQIEGGTAIALTGTGFKQGAFVLFGGLPASGVEVASEGQIALKTPAHDPGLVDVAVTNPDGASAIVRGGYDYYASGPVLVAVTPDHGSPSGGTSVVISGRGFKETTAVAIGGAPVTDLKRLDSQTLTAVTPPGAEGKADVVALDPDGQSDTLAGGFTYGTSTGTTLGLLRVMPTSGPNSGGTHVTLLGSGFDSTVKVSVGGASATGVTVSGPASLTAVTPAGAIGPADVVVEKGAEKATLAGSFWYFDGTVAGTDPVLSTVAPSSGPADGGSTVLLIGSGFSAGAKVFFGTVPAKSVRFVSATTLSAVTDAAAAPGMVDVRVQNPDGRVGRREQAFLFLDRASLGPAPVLQAIAPSSGGTLDPTPVSVAGQNVVAGALLFVDGVPATGVKVVASGVEGVFPPLPAGAKDVAVTNPDGQTGTLPLGFTYVGSGPQLSSVTPSIVPLSGGPALLLFGRGFVQGATATIGGSAGWTTDFVDSTLVVVAAPPHAAGPVDVKVTNPDGTSSTLANAVTYSDLHLGPAPSLTAIAPTSGPATGGTLALLTGANLASDAKVLFGSAWAGRVTVASAAELSALSPGGIAGAVDVRVLNPDGQSAALPQAFRYVDPATLGAGPTLASVAPAQGSEAGGTPTALSGTALANPLLVFFGGRHSPDALSQSATAATATTPAVPAGEVDVSVTNPDGQTYVLPGAFRFQPKPATATLFPTRGPTDGGTVAVLRGSGFSEDSAVTFGGSAAASISLVDSGTLVVVTPPGAAGAVDVTITSPGSAALTLAAGFTYWVRDATSPPAPTLSSIQPNTGPSAGGTYAIVRGGDLADGVLLFVGGAPATETVLADAQTLTGRVPAGAVGPADVSVTNPDGQSARLPGAFAYYAGSGNPPTLAAVTPKAGSTAGGTAVSLTGAAFRAGGLVLFGGRPATGVQVPSAALATAVTPIGLPGLADVVFTNPDGTSSVLRGGYGYYVGGPVVLAVTPSWGPPAGGTSVLVEGRNFQQGAVATFDGQTLGALTWLDERTLSGTTGAGLPGPAAVTVTNPDGQSDTLQGGFTFGSGPTTNVLALDRAIPEVGPLTGGTVVTLVGSGFDAGATVTVGGVAATGVKLLGATSLSAVVPAGAAVGPAAIEVKVGSETASLAHGFWYFDPASTAPAPLLTGIAPTSGPATGGTMALLSGTGFAGGARVFFGVDEARSVRFIGATSASAVTRPAAAGPVDLRIMNPDGRVGRLDQSFVFIDPASLGSAPVVRSSTPATGGTLDPTTVSLSTTSVQPGAMVFVDGVPATNVTVGATAVGATFAPMSAGTVDVTVTNPDGQSASLPGGFRFVTSPPTLASISPLNLPLAGGLSVFVNGRGFLPGAKVTIGGTEAAQTFASGTLLVVTAPAHAAGAVDLTVTNPDGQAATAASALTYADIVVGPAPGLAAVLPASGPATGGTLCVVTGSNFADGITVQFGTAVATRVTVIGPTRLSAQAPAGSLGPVDVTVTNPDGQSAQLLKAFTYVDPATLGPAPTLGSVTPASGLAAGGTQSILTGSGFKASMIAFFGGYDASATVQSGGIARSITPAGPQGTVDVAVTNPDGQSAILAGAFKYTPAPEPLSIAPATSATTGGVAFTLAGTGFVAGARVFFDAAQAGSVTVASATVLTGVTPAHAAGSAVVQVVNPDGQSGLLAGAFAFLAPPTVTAVKPGVVPVDGGAAVTVTGTNLEDGATVSIGGKAATSVVVLDANTLVATVPAGAGLGPVDVAVTNPDGQIATAVTGSLTYEAVELVAFRSFTYPDAWLPLVRDDATYRTSVVLSNLSTQAANVTLSEYDATGALVATRAVVPAIPAGGRATVADVLQFIEAGSVPTGRTATVLVKADAPVMASGVVTDRTSGDASMLLALPASRASSTLLLPYVSSVGVYKTWLGVLNTGTASASVSLKARDASGSVAGTKTVTVPAGGQYTVDDVLGSMGLTGAAAILEISSDGPKLLAAGRTWSSTRQGALVPARARTEAATSTALAWLPDTTAESSSIHLANPDATTASSVTLNLRGSDGKSWGTRTVTVPALGFVQIADLARTLLGKTQPTQSVTSVQITASRPLLAMASVINATSGDLRLYSGRSAGGLRLVLPAADATTALTVANFGAAASPVEIRLRDDSGFARGNVLKVSLPAGGLFSAPQVLASLGAGASAGTLEVLSPTGVPIAAAAKVAGSSGGSLGDALDLGSVLTVPALDSVAPAHGPATGGTVALVKGAYFLPGPTFLFGSAPAQRAQVYSEDRAAVVSPAGTAGQTAGLWMINLDGGQTTLNAAFGWLDPATLGSPPAVTSVTPSQVSTLGGTAVQIAGTGFATGAIAFMGLNPAANCVQVSPQQVDALAPSGPVGPADVTVTNPDGQSGTLSAGVQFVVPPPTLVSVTPGTGPAKGGTAVVVVGQAFQLGASLSFGATPAVGTTVVSSTRIEATSPAGNDGPVAVTVTNADGQSASLSNGFLYVAGPEVLSVSPTSGPVTGGTSVQIVGKYFSLGATVTVGGVAATGVIRVSGQVLQATTPAGSAGPAAVAVTNPDGQVGTLSNAFTYLAPVPAPTVSAVSPNYGPTTGGAQVTVQGSAFQAGAVVKFGGTSSTSATVISPSAIVAVAPGAAGPGPVDVTVVNPDLQSGTLTNGFTYFQPADLPAIALISLTPNQGPAAGGNSVFVSGNGFKNGVTVSFGGALAPSVNYLGPSALLVVAPAHALGAVSVTATNPDGTNATLAGAYAYTTDVVFSQPPMRMPMVTEPGWSMVRLVDFDNDGDQDVFVGRYPTGCGYGGDDQLYVNDGAGNFSATTLPTKRHLYSGGLYYGSVTAHALVADFDANGTQDVFTLPDYFYPSTWDTRMSGHFYKNAPLGTWTRSDIAQFGANSVSIRGASLGDLNRDGYPDVFVVMNGQSFQYRNNKNGTFTGMTTGLPTLSGDSRAACVADFDNDGDDDIFVVNGSNQQAWLWLQDNGAPGTFGAAPAASLPVSGGNGTGCVAAELRPGSGVKDLVVVRDGQAYQYLKNDGFAKFTDETSMFIYRLPASPPSTRIGFYLPPGTSTGLVGGVEAVDVDGDGDLDLVMNHVDLNPRAQIYLNDGAGFFAVGTSGRMPATLADRWWAIGDLNSDGKQDMVQIQDGNQPRLLLGSAGGKFAYSTMKSLPETNYTVPDAVYGDLDNDGDQDLVLAAGCRFNSCSTDNPGCRWNSVRIWTNDGLGGYTDQTDVRFPPFGGSASTLKIEDLDGDGDLDLVVGSTFTNSSWTSGMNLWTIRLFLNDGAGNFSEASYLHVPYYNEVVSSLALGDFNKDGAPDIYWTSYNECGSYAYQRLFQNTGNGYFIDATSQLPYDRLPNYERTRAALVADFNRDGYPDIYAGNIPGSDGQNRLFLNKGVSSPGYFTDVTATYVPNVTDATFALASGDLNNDTFPDLFVCNGQSGGNGAKRMDFGNSAGVLSDVSATNLPSEYVPYPYPWIYSCGGTVGPQASYSCALGDVDGDGDLDIMLGGADQSNVNMRTAFWSNVGGGVFQAKTTASLPNITDQDWKVLLFDANGDGKLDLFTGVAGQQKVYLQQ